MLFIRFSSEFFHCLYVLCIWFISSRFVNTSDDLCDTVSKNTMEKKVKIYRTQPKPSRIHFQSYKWSFPLLKQIFVQVFCCSIQWPTDSVKPILCTVYQLKIYKLITDTQSTQFQLIDLFIFQIDEIAAHSDSSSLKKIRTIKSSQGETIFQKKEEEKTETSWHDGIRAENI